VIEMTDRRQEFDKLCLYCTGFKTCEGLPVPMGWCKGKYFNKANMDIKYYEQKVEELEQKVQLRDRQVAYMRGCADCWHCEHEHECHLKHIEIHENRVISDLEKKVEELEQKVIEKDKRINEFGDAWQKAEQKVKELEEKVRDLESHPTTYTEAHYYADKLRYEARIAELEAKLKKWEGDHCCKNCGVQHCDSVSDFAVCSCWKPKK